MPSKMIYEHASKAGRGPPTRLAPDVWPPLPPVYVASLDWVLHAEWLLSAKVLRNTTRIASVVVGAEVRQAHHVGLKGSQSEWRFATCVAACLGSQL